MTVPIDLAARRAARVLEEARHASPNAVDRANLACQAADIYANELGERTRALDLYHVVLASDPERADAAAPLAERYWQRAGINSVPAVVIDGKHLIQGGQPADVFERALRQIAAQAS